ncbi:MAG: pyridoxamine 5'-phosphate oxidase family protein [Desulfobacterales bacterium]|nr:pyridoxamine 5'-phosphate oxidase family protein [Desulfobacterales bacterium]
MEPKQVMEMFNKRPRIGTLSTANKDGDVNVAIFGSPQMTDENTVVMGIGDNRSLSYLRENPKAVFIVMEPGKTPMDWKGCRVYLAVDRIQDQGEMLDSIRAKIAEAVGEGAAKMIHAAVRFKVTEVRDLIAAP